jgi:hypothetical protein
MCSDFRATVRPHAGAKTPRFDADDDRGRQRTTEDALYRPRMATRRDLFGGALTADIPEDFLDVSDVIPIDDHQEVFSRASSDESIVIEVLDRVRDVDDASIGRCMFTDMCELNEAIESSLGYEGEDALERRLAGVSTSRIVFGTMRASKHRSAYVNDVDVWGCVMRIPRVESEIVIWHARPTRVGDPNASVDVRAPSDIDRVREGDHTCSPILLRVIESFRICDWSLFGVDVVAP